MSFKKDLYPVGKKRAKSNISWLIFANEDSNFSPILLKRHNKSLLFKKIRI
jgi:hypothetical protein